MMYVSRVRQRGGKMLRVGLIGFGTSGQFFHAPVIRTVKGLELACILERTGPRASEIYPGVRVARNLEELLSDDTIRICVIATPNTTHYELARKCLLASRDVVIDKPFTVTTAEARELIALAEKQKRLLTVYQNRRWDGDFLTVQKLLASGTLGRVTYLESHFDRFRPQLKTRAWREDSESGGGALLDLGAHLVDQAIALFGRPKSICAETFREREGSRVEDGFDLHFEYPAMRVLLSSSALRCTPGPRFAVHGDKGSFVKYGIEPQEERLRRGEYPSANDWGLETEASWGTLHLPDGTVRQLPTETGNYARFYENLRDVIVDGAPLAVKPSEALWTIRALELARQSSASKSSISWDENDS
jgi:scyllo-inositol 2-dehydrogenase (NADP+)